MKEYQDAHGRLMYECFKGEEVYEIVERDDCYIQAMPVSAYFRRYKDWSSNEKEAMKHVRGRVLDIGCGAGRHSLFLQRKGFDVLGVDTSPLAIKVSKLRGLRRTGVMSITQLGPKLGMFDTLLMLGNNFGLFGGLNRARWLLRRFHSMTSSSGRIIAETRDPYRTENPFHLHYHRLNRRRGRMAGQIRMRVRDEKYATPWFDYLFVSMGEMKRLVKGTGWKVGRFIDSGDPTYMAIIEKEAV